MPKRKLIAADRIEQRNSELKRWKRIYANFSKELIRSMILIVVEMLEFNGGLKKDSEANPFIFGLLRNFLYAVLRTNIKWRIFLRTGKYLKFTTSANGSWNGWPHSVFSILYWFLFWAFLEGPMGRENL